MQMAETMEDSGIDSDQRTMNGCEQESPMRVRVRVPFCGTPDSEIL